MDRRRFLLTSLTGALGAPVAAGAQQARKTPRIGWLTDSVVHQHNVEAFRQGMRALGYADTPIDFQAAAGVPSKLPTLAAALVAHKVDIIVTDGGGAVAAAKQATSTIPVVMGTIGDPVAAGIVASLARPGGNVTGLTLDAGVEIHSKRLELLREAVPGVGRIAVMWNPGNPGARWSLAEVISFAKKVSIQIISVEAGDMQGIERAFAAAVGNHASALQTLPDAFLWTLRSRIVMLAARSRLRRYILRASLSRREDFSRTDRMSRTISDAPRSMSIASSRAPTPATSPSSDHRSSNWCLISTPPRPLASRSRPRCWRGRIR